MSVNHIVTQFKFKWINQNGDEEGFRRKKGSFDGETLQLDDVEIPAEAIISLETRENRIILAIPTDEEEPSVLAIAVSGVTAKQLKAKVDVARSATWARAEKKEFESKGEVHLYREATCQHCDAVLTMSRMQETPQLFCTYCDTLTTTHPNQDTPPNEKTFKICEECGMFSQPKKFTIFYFYFLVVIYGFRQSTTWRCPACMRGEAWKMFFGNLIFILGVPISIIQLVRSYGGTVTGKFAGLDNANIKAKSGKAAKALEQYQKIAEKVPCSAGLKYNIGISLLEQNPEMAAATFEMALSDCCNYWPAANALGHCYEQIGAKDKLVDLHRIWGIEEEKEEAAPVPKQPATE